MSSAPSAAVTPPVNDVVNSTAAVSAAVVTDDDGPAAAPAADADADADADAAAADDAEPVDLSARVVALPNPYANLMNDFKPIPKWTLTYYTLDNGGIPFIVVIQHNRIQIWLYSTRISREDVLIKEYFSYQNYFIGKDVTYKEYDGHVIAIELTTEIVVIGISVQVITKQANEQLLGVHSVIGNSAVPYSFVETNQRYIDMCEWKEISSALIASYIQKGGHTFDVLMQNPCGTFKKKTDEIQQAYEQLTPEAFSQWKKVDLTTLHERP